MEKKTEKAMKEQGERGRYMTTVLGGSPASWL